MGLKEIAKKAQVLRADYEKQLAVAVKDVTKDAKKFLAKDAKSLFNKFPDLQYIYWEQYTPYWNDGSECVFTIYGVQGYVGPLTDEIEGVIDSVDTETLTDLANVGEQYNNAMADVKVTKALGVFEQNLNDLDTILRDTVGDHSCILITRDNIVIEEFEHD